LNPAAAGDPVSEVLSGLNWPSPNLPARSNWQSYWIILTPECPKCQVELMQGLLARGIHTRRGVMCAHREPAYRDLELRHPLPVSEYLQDRSIILPLYPDMTEAEQDLVTTALREILI
jgi:perosamine synthetase